MNIKYQLFSGAYAPARAHETDAGWDLRTPIDFWIYSGECALVDTGVSVEIPEGFYGRLASKSGLNCNHGIVSEGVIDSGYTGTIRVKLYNHSDKNYHFERGDKITQLIIEVLPAITMTEGKINQNTDRGDAGFGSTGK